MIVYTWNMEHGSDRWTRLNSFSAADALCLQETSTYPSNLTLRTTNGQAVYMGSQQLGSSDRGKSFTIALAWFGQTGMNSVAVMVSGRHKKRYAIPPPIVNTRTTIGLQHSNGVWFFSIHAPSAGGNAWQLAWIQTVLQAINNYCAPAPWICAGDYNASPAFVRPLCPPGSVVVNPERPTHQGGGELDFAVCRPAGLITTASVGDGYIADHWPVKLE